MRILIIGAGAVGAVLGVALEHMKHEVTWLVRKGRRKGMAQILIVDEKGRTRCRERPSVVELGDRPPPFEWVLLCVRGDQIDEAITTLSDHVRDDARIGVAAAAMDGLERIRAALPEAAVFSILPTFSAHAEEPNVFHWFQPPLLKTLLSGEGDEEAVKAAAEMTQALVAAGVAARTVVSLRRSVVPLLGPGAVLIGAWELAGWDPDRLARERELRGLAARAMAEATKQSANASLSMRLLSYAPAAAFNAVLATLPRLAPGQVRTMWRHHGPKIRQQTRMMLDQVIARTPRDGATALRELRQRLDAAAG